MDKRLNQDPFLVNSVLWAFLVLALSVQILTVVVWLYSFVPIKTSALMQTLFYRHMADVFPKRDMFFYHFFIVQACALMAIGILFLRERLSQSSFTPTLLRLTVAEYGCSLLIIFAVFKMLVYGEAVWTKHLFYFSLSVSVLAKVFFKELGSIYAQVLSLWQQGRLNARLRLYYDLAFVVLIFLIIYIPDTNGLIAKMFMTDHFHHFDTMIMSPAWASIKGAVLDIDQFTHYSIGLAVVIGRLSSILGGFTYPSVIKLLCLGTVVYYVAAYALARYWIKSIPLAVAMLLLLIKWQMFHPGVASVIFNYPSASIWRYPLDILVLFLLLLDLREPKPQWLMMAAVLCGFSCFYMMDTGVYLSIAFAFYLASDLILRLGEIPRRSIRAELISLGGYLLLVAVSALTFLFMAQGHYLFTQVLWKNLPERTALFLMGHGDLPMYKSLIEGKYLASWMGFFIPLFYVLVLMLGSTLLYFKKIPKEFLFVLTLTVYGLGLYHYYVVRSADTSYDVIVLPFVFILGFLLNIWIGLEHPYRRQILSAVVGFLFFALLTNHYFLNYPNLLQLSSNPFTRPLVGIKVDDGLSYLNHNELVISPAIKLSVNSLGETDEMLKTEKDFDNDAQFKDFAAKEFDFSTDAKLITGLTSKEEKIPLICSFETKILMQADRRPFFYYFPLVDSSPSRMRIFPFTSLWTTGRLDKTLKQLQDEKPKYVFMEKILMAQSVPASYQYLYPEVLAMLSYIHQHYLPFQQGKYLIALKRKDNL